MLEVHGDVYAYCERDKWCLSPFSIGIEDGTRAVRGVSDPLGTEERLANIISAGITPIMMPGIEILAWRQTQVLAVEVAAGPSRPCYITGEGPERGVYVRVGSSNRRADAALIAEMQRTVARHTFDEEAAAGADSEEIDFRAASELFAGKRNLRPADEICLGLRVRVGRRSIPTNGGILLFGNSREKVFPDAWLQCGFFPGLTKAHIADTAEYHEHLPLLPDQAMGCIKKHAGGSGGARRNHFKIDVNFC